MKIKQLFYIVALFVGAASAASATSFSSDIQLSSSSSCGGISGQACFFSSQGVSFNTYTISSFSGTCSGSYRVRAYVYPLSGGNILVSDYVVSGSAVGSYSANSYSQPPNLYKMVSIGIADCGGDYSASGVLILNGDIINFPEVDGISGSLTYFRELITGKGWWAFGILLGVVFVVGLKTGGIV